MHPLDGPRLKVARAKTEINRLTARQNVFFKKTHYSVVRTEQNPITGKHIYRIKIDGPPPSLDWGVYIGEIAHNLRSALNLLIYQLALLNSAHKPETIARDTRLQFPIFLHSGDFRLKGGENMIKLLRPEHKAFIKRLQPYKRSHGMKLKTVDLSERRGRNNPLFWLEKINNADKHRIIQVVAVKAGVFGFTYWGEQPKPPFEAIKGYFSILKDGAKFGESLPNVQVNVHLSPLIAFSGHIETIRNKPVCLLLNRIRVTVSEIIEMFAPEFG